ncbi:related to C6 finger domain protein [Fusarium mangiferae]|uniref:Related to C6 finger domain protein n=1 Tax=Fusarium mangiferae TaxID=192010 RepID=A0A1L7UK99_FUSMA|nr:uncharacterized protein FMAN_05203 [Fusarium mangiferae]CVL08485.1 related to C6 finger domain protein [Fusarium mangiferae]
MFALQSPPVRKGTKSCRECRRRKVRCVRIPEDSPTCRQCVERNTSCLAQTSSGRTRQLHRLPSGYRLTRLESQVNRLTKNINDIQVKLGGEPILQLEQELDQSLVSDGSDAESTSSAGFIAEESSQLHSLFHNDILSFDISQKHEHILERRTRASASLRERARPALQRLIPSKEETANMLVITFDWLQMLASLLPQPSSPESHHALLARYDEMCQPDVDAVDLASWLLAVAITAQQIPQERNGSESPSLDSKKRMAFSRAVSEAVESLVLSHDRLVGTIPGLGLGLHFVRLLMGRGDFQQAWLKLRHFIALAELMGLPKAAQSGLNEESARKAQAWTLMCTIDRMVCMFINLPAYTRRSPNMAPLPIMVDGVVQPSVYLSRLMDIAPEAFGLDDLSGTQDSKAASYTAVLEVAREARSLAGEAPKSWWAFHMDQDLKPDHIVQFVHYCLLMKAHLPIVLRQKGSEDYGYDHLGCIDACQSVAQRYQFIRRKLPPGFFSLNVLDLQAFTAVILLLLMPYSSTLTDLHIFQIDKSGIECVVAQVLQLMEEKSDKGVGSDFARRGAHTIRSLRDLLQQDEDPGNSVNEITANVPLIGTIRVRRNRKASPNLNNHSQVSSNQGPQAAQWDLQEQAGYSSELNTGISLQNSAIESFMAPEFQWDQLLWSIEDSNNCMLYNYSIIDELN